MQLQNPGKSSSKFSSANLHSRYPIRVLIFQHVDDPRNTFGKFLTIPSTLIHLRGNV